MAIFNCYVSSPEGNDLDVDPSRNSFFSHEFQKSKIGHPSNPQKFVGNLPHRHVASLERSAAVGQQHDQRGFTMGKTKSSMWKTHGYPRVSIHPTSVVAF